MASRPWFGTDDVPDWPGARERIFAIAGPEGFSDEWGAVSLVGLGTGSSPRHLAEIHRIASGLGASVDHLMSSPLRVTAFCRASDADTLLAALHRAFCE